MKKLLPISNAWLLHLRIWFSRSWAILLGKSSKTADDPLGNSAPAEDKKCN